MPIDKLINACKTYFHPRSKKNKLDTTMTDLLPLLFQFRDTGDHSPETQVIKIKGVNPKVSIHHKNKLLLNRNSINHTMKVNFLPDKNTRSFYVDPLMKGGSYGHHTKYNLHGFSFAAVSCKLLIK